MKEGGVLRNKHEEKGGGVLRNKHEEKGGGAGIKEQT